MDYQELIKKLRDKAEHNQYKYSDALMIEAADAVESLLAENERLKHNLSTTEQTMREYQELAAKRLEEIAKYRDAPVVAWYYFNLDDAECFGHPEGYYPDDAKPLIVKPGEEE